MCNCMAIAASNRTEKCDWLSEHASHATST